jgi:hypothetical protein
MNELEPPLTDLEHELPHWHDQPDLYDVLFLGGRQMPGIATVKVTRRRKIDKKSAKGKNKATVTVQGYEPAELEITLKMLTPEDMTSLYEAVPLLEPTADRTTAKDADALDIAHYTTSFRDIKAVVVESLEGPELVNGEMFLKIKACEFRKPPKATGKGGGGGASGVVVIGLFGYPGGKVSDSTIATPLGNAKNPDGSLIVDEFGETFFNWTIVGKADKNAHGFVYASGSMVARFLGPDAVLQAAWEASKLKPNLKDVTNTPDASKGEPEPSPQATANAPKDPTLTDGGPSIFTTTP